MVGGKRAEKNTQAGEMREEKWPAKVKVGPEAKSSFTKRPCPPAMTKPTLVRQEIEEVA